MSTCNLSENALIYCLMWVCQRETITHSCTWSTCSIQSSKQMRSFTKKNFANFFGIEKKQNAITTHLFSTYAGGENYRMDFVFLSWKKSSKEILTTETFTKIGYKTLIWAKNWTYRRCNIENNISNSLPPTSLPSINWLCKIYSNICEQVQVLELLSVSGSLCWGLCGWARLLDCEVRVGNLGWDI